MEPPVRPYHPNGASARRPRGSRAPQRQIHVVEQPENPNKNAVPTKSRAKRGTGERERSVANSERDLSAQSNMEAPVVAEVAVEMATTPDSADESLTSEQTEASDDAIESLVPAVGPGPVVGIDDFEDIFTRFQTPITNFVYRLVGNREQAYDLAQDVFVKAYRALAGGATIQAGALSSWLYRIASNTATDALRRRRLISWLPLSLFNDDRGVGAGMPAGDSGFSLPSPTDEHLASAMGAFTASYDGGRFEQRVADREVVERVLKRLPEKYAACLLLYEHEGFSCAEIANVLNVTPSAVKMRLMRARERFINLYQQEMEGHR